MKANGYLEFAKNARDNRKQEIRLTKKAKQEFKKNEEIWLACEHAMASIFSNDTFLTELKKFEQAISKASFKKRAIKQLTINKVKCVDFKAKHKKAFKILNVNWLEKYFKVEPIDLKILDFPKAYIIDKKGKIFMAEIEGKAIGTVALIKYPKKPIELAKMAVDDDFQGLGIGHQLMEVAIAYCKEQKYKSVMLYTHKILKPAIHLYEKFGFKQVKLEPNSGYDRADYKMELKL